MKRWLALVLAVVVAAPALAGKPTRGEAVIARLSLQPITTIASELVTIRVDDPITAEQYARLIELRKRVPSLLRLGALDDPDLTAVAETLCHADSGDCVDGTTRTLRCLADRCAVVLPKQDPKKADVITLPPDCHQYSTHQRSPAYGVGVDWSTGAQTSRYPTDTGAWSFGIEGRYRFSHLLGAVARVDRIAGRDEATDVDNNGHDDVSTGEITRIDALAGPSFVIDSTRFDDSQRFLRVDVLGGYLSTRSQPNESGPAAGIDVAYQVWAFRFGLRYVQGFADASNASILLAHIGFTTGSDPQYDSDADCGSSTSIRSSRLALGFDFPLLGYGLSSELGYVAPSLGIEMPYHLTHRLDAIARGDLLIYPGYQRDRTLHQALLAGIRIDHSDRTTGYFTTVMAGYTHGIGFTPTTVGSGAVADVGFGWGGQGAEGAGSVRVHYRQGVGPDNFDYRAVFISGGFELRFDPHSWRDRDMP
jgi:hypothetical protein